MCTGRSSLNISTQSAPVPSSSSATSSAVHHITTSPHVGLQYGFMAATVPRSGAPPNNDSTRSCKSVATTSVSEDPENLLLELPTEIKVVILSQLPLSDVMLNVAASCRQLSELCRTDKMWMALFIHRWKRWRPELDDIRFSNLPLPPNPASTNSSAVDSNAVDNSTSITAFNSMKSGVQKEDHIVNEQCREKKKRRTAHDALWSTLNSEASTTSPPIPITTTDPNALKKASWQERYRFFHAGYWTWNRLSGRAAAWSVQQFPAGKKLIYDPLDRSEFQQSDTPQSMEIPGIGVRPWLQPEDQQTQYSGETLAPDQLWAAVIGEYRFEVHVIAIERQIFSDILVDFVIGQRGPRGWASIRWSTYSNGTGTIRVSGDENWFSFLGMEQPKFCWPATTAIVPPYSTGDTISWTFNLRKRRLCFQLNGKDIHAIQLSADSKVITKVLRNCWIRPAISTTPGVSLEIRDADVPGNLPLSSPHRCMLDEPESA